MFIVRDNVINSQLISSDYYYLFHHFDVTNNKVKMNPYLFSSYTKY